MQANEMLACLAAIHETGTIFLEEPIHRGFELLFGRPARGQQAPMSHLMAENGLGILAHGRYGCLVEERSEMEVAVGNIRLSFIHKKEATRYCSSLVA